MPAALAPDLWPCACLSAGAEWTLEQEEPCTVFTPQSVHDCVLQNFSCSALRKVDGAEHLILIKGNWASPSFYVSGACSCVQPLLSTLRTCTRAPDFF